MTDHEHTVTLRMRPCANGETVECFFEVDGRPIYGPANCGAFLNRPSAPEAFRAAIRMAAIPKEA